MFQNESCQSKGLKTDVLGPCFFNSKRKIRTLVWSLIEKDSGKKHIVRNPYYICIGNIATQIKNPVVMGKSIFYHAGCPVCVQAESEIVSLLGAENVEVVHFGVDKSRIAEAEKVGVKSVPALLTPSGNVLHLNFGASMEDVKA